MGIFSVFSGISRDNLAEKLGLLGQDLDRRIDAKAEEFEAENGPNPLAILAAISQVESELLEEHYTGTNIKQLHQKWIVIMETMYFKRVAVIKDDPSVFLHFSVKDGIRKFIKDRYRELSATVEYSMLPMLALVDRAMLECMASGAPKGQDFCAWVREVCHSGYKAKEEVLNHRL